MIIEEKDVNKENEQKAEKLKEILKDLELPKKCIIEDDGSPYYGISISEKRFLGKDEIATLSLNADGSINVNVDNDENRDILRECLTNSKLKFRLIRDGGFY